MVQDGMLLAVFNSAHRVMKAEYLLKAKGVAILLIPAPRAISTDCGLAIRYTEEYKEIVFEILHAGAILPTVIYRKMSDTNYQEIWTAENT